MIPVVIQERDITPEDLALLEDIARAVRRLPDGLTCHEVCTSLAHTYRRLVHVRGYFLNKGWRHSWLEERDGYLLIDPYPWAGHTPLMVTTRPLSPWRYVYVAEITNLPLYVKQVDAPAAVEEKEVS